MKNLKNNFLIMLSNGRYYDGNDLHGVPIDYAGTIEPEDAEVFTTINKAKEYMDFYLDDVEGCMVISRRF